MPDEIKHPHYATVVMWADDIMVSWALDGWFVTYLDVEGRPIRRMFATEDEAKDFVFASNWNE